MSKTTLPGLVSKRALIDRFRVGRSGRLKVSLARSAPSEKPPHVFNAKLDPKYPATLSHAAITGILRGQLGWDKVVLSDDMQMGAIRDAFGYADALRLAIEAGIDILTIAALCAMELRRRRMRQDQATS